jgi:hypothetical protein
MKSVTVYNRVYANLLIGLHETDNVLARNYVSEALKLDKSGGSFPEITLLKEGRGMLADK